MRQWLKSFLVTFSLLALVATGFLYVHCFYRIDNLSANWASLSGRNATLYRGYIVVKGGLVDCSLSRFKSSSVDEIDRFAGDSGIWRNSLSFRVDPYPVAGLGHYGYMLPNTHAGFSFTRAQVSIYRSWLGTGRLLGPFSDEINLSFPLWLPTIFFAVVPLSLLPGIFIIRNRRRRGACAGCGYDLRASALRCPECGRPFTSAPMAPQRTRGKRLSLALWTASPILACGVVLIACGVVIASRQRFITHRFDVNRDFWNAVKNNDADTAQAAIARGAVADLRGSAGRSALLNAAINRHSSRVIQFLLQGGADPNAQVGEDYPLTFAVRDARVDVVELLLKAGANPSAARAGWASPLEVAIVQSHDPRRDRIACILIEAGADVKRDFTYGNSPIFYAVIYGCHVDTLRAIVRHGADWRGDDRGAKLLSKAFGSQNYQAAQLLVDLGADKSMADRVDLRRLKCP